MQRISVLILSEDSSETAFAVIRQFVLLILKKIQPALDSRLIDFEPLYDDSATRALRANRWKSREPRDYQFLVSLRRYIATKLRRIEWFCVFSPWTAIGRGRTAWLARTWLVLMIISGRQCGNYCEGGSVKPNWRAYLRTRGLDAIL